MQLIKKETCTQVTSQNYSIAFYHTGRKALLAIPGKRFHYMLALFGACNTPETLDVTKSTSPFSFNKEKGGVVLSFKEESSIWTEKTHTITMTDS